MKIPKKIKVFFCSHKYVECGKDYFNGCIVRYYYRCEKCGKLISERWKWE